MPELLFEVRPAPTMLMFEMVMPAVLYAATPDDWPAAMVARPEPYDDTTIGNGPVPLSAASNASVPVNV